MTATSTSCIAIAWRGYATAKKQRTSPASFLPAPWLASTTSAEPPFAPGSFSIAHNAVADFYRSAGMNSPLAHIAHLPAPGPSLEEQATSGERREAVRQALTQLSAEQRQVVELRMAGMTGPEIAQALGRSHDSVRTTQRRALAQIRTLLGITPEQREGRDAS